MLHSSLSQSHHKDTTQFTMWCVLFKLGWVNVGHTGF
ncbi:hypothetical protein ABIF65_008558 [Bradyrhizobium japonicum]|nr:hypothetical protein [Bradyrhizobium japonicum]MCP1864366.1 hypothetical protein [Bradyrhizobium japonicum]MCP1894953.1 hypothetical protein [Bradyrhizobium japonicum]MCW2328337.1 hypothetical protein [Bradyrhizobium japonicum]